MNSRRSISFLGVVTLLTLAAGCIENTYFETGKIENFHAFRHFESTSPANPDNLVNQQQGVFTREYYHHIDGVAGYSLEPDYFPVYDNWIFPDYYLHTSSGQPGIGGAAFTIDLDDQWTHKGLLSQDIFWEMLMNMYVFEFTFPESPYPNGTSLYWNVQPYLYCTYMIQESSDPNSNRPVLWVEYLVYEDPLGMLNLTNSNKLVLSETLMTGIEDEKKYAFTGNSRGQLMAFHDERNGTMTVLPGFKPNLFLGVSVVMFAWDRGDRILIGSGNFQSQSPRSHSHPSDCLLSFSGYYVMRPLQSTNRD